MTALQRVQCKRRGISTFTVEKSDRHNLSQVTQVTSRVTSCFDSMNPTGCGEGAASLLWSVSQMPPQCNPEKSTEKS